MEHANDCDNDHDIDIRPITIDKLTQLPAEALQSRQQRIVELLEIYQGRVEEARAVHERLRELYEFLEQQLANVELAVKLQIGDVVRVKCPTCSGSGMKPTDVLSGHILQNQGSAFESVRSKGTPKIDPALQCEECAGKCWVLMERFRG